MKFPIRRQVRYVPHIVALAFILLSFLEPLRADNQDHGPVYTVGQRVWFEERGCFEYQPGAGAWSGSGEQASWSPFISCEQIDREKAYVQAQALALAQAREAELQRQAELARISANNAAALQAQVELAAISSDMGSGVANVPKEYVLAAVDQEMTQNTQTAVASSGSDEVLSGGSGVETVQGQLPSAPLDTGWSRNSDGSFSRTMETPNLGNGTVSQVSRATPGPNSTYDLSVTITARDANGSVQTTRETKDGVPRSSGEKTVNQMGKDALDQNALGKDILNRDFQSIRSNPLLRRMSYEEEEEEEDEVEDEAVEVGETRSDGTVQQKDEGVMTTTYEMDGTMFGAERDTSVGGQDSNSPEVTGQGSEW